MAIPFDREPPKFDVTHREAHFGVDNSATLRARGPGIQMVTPLCALVAGLTVVWEMCSPKCLRPIMYYLSLSILTAIFQVNLG